MDKVLRACAEGALLLCFGLPAFAYSDPADLDTEIAAQQRASYELEKKIQQYNETARIKSQQARGLQARLSNLQQNTQAAQQRITLLELQSDKLQRSINTLSVETAETSRQIESLMTELGSRVVDMYKYRTREELNLLLSAEDAHEVVALAYLLERLARHDRLIIEKLLSKTAELEHGKRSIERNKAQLITQTEELDSLRKRYGDVINKTNTQLSDVQRERQRAEAAAKEMERAQRETERVLVNLMRQKRERPQDALYSAQETSSAAQEVQTYPVLERETLLSWPVKGDIIGHYGPREHPVFKTKSFNPGIEISASSGAPVMAAGPGEVLYEGWLRGFGQVVVIDHGRNISTVYAHLASTRVKEKDAVMTGAVIGTVGNTGTLEGYNLHFEVRVGEAAKNPLDYLKKT